MRNIGDLYIKHEFRENHRKSNLQQYKTFYNSWNKYEKMLYLSDNKGINLARPL
jgi:hypothetical protein